MPSKIVETNAAKTPLEKLRADLAVQVGVTAKDTFAIGRGDVVGIIQSSGLARRRSRAAVTGTAFATTTATGTVDDGTVFAVGDVLKNSAGAVIGTIQSIVGNLITLTANAAVAVATGANVFGSDGSQTAVGIADEGSNGSGDTPIRMFIGGYLNESLFLRLDPTAKTELGGISTVDGIFKF